MQPQLQGLSGPYFHSVRRVILLSLVRRNAGQSRAPAAASAGELWLEKEKTVNGPVSAVIRCPEGATVVLGWSLARPPRWVNTGGRIIGRPGGLTANYALGRLYGAVLTLPNPDCLSSRMCGRKPCTRNRDAGVGSDPFSQRHSKDSGLSGSSVAGATRGAGFRPIGVGLDTAVTLLWVSSAFSGHDFRPARCMGFLSSPSWAFPAVRSRRS